MERAERSIELSTYYEKLIEEKAEKFREFRERINRDPVSFARVFLLNKDHNPWVARPYQAEMLRDTSEKKIYLGGRRTGMSEMLLVEAIWLAMTNRNWQVIFFTPYETSANDCMWQALELLSETFNNNDSYYVTRDHSLVFSSGSRILFRCEARPLLGVSANALLVDNAYLSDRRLEEALLTVAGTKDALVRLADTSSFRIHDGFFKQLCEGNQGYVLHRAPSTLIPGWSEEIEAEYKSMLSEDRFRREFLLEFVTQ